jgi:hypothetical protein
MTLSDIENKTRQLASARATLGLLVQSLNDEIEGVKRKAMTQLKSVVARAAARHEELRAAIESAPELFEKPRTQVFHSIKVGLREGTGAIDWQDDEHVADLIQKHFPELFDALLTKRRRRPRDFIRANSRMRREILLRDVDLGAGRTAGFPCAPSQGAQSQLGDQGWQASLPRMCS